MLEPIHHKIICMVSLGVIASYLFYRWYTYEEQQKEYENMSFFEAMLKEDEERREAEKPNSARSEEPGEPKEEEPNSEGKKPEDSLRTAASPNTSELKTAVVPSTPSCSKEPDDNATDTNSSK